MQSRDRSLSNRLSMIRPFHLVGVLFGALALMLLGGCGQKDVNQAKVSTDRLAAFKSESPLVFRTLSQPIVMPKAQFQTVSGNFDMPKAFSGHWTLLYTGYTFCPDVCPMELNHLAQLMPNLHKALPKVSWQVVFLSVDPARDSPARIHEYLQYFDPDFIGITGSRSAIDAVTGAVKAGYRIAPHASGDQTYDISHDTAFRLISPNGRMVAILPSPHHIPEITRDLQKFFKEVVE
jgi:cytochrome oxidase Cu insertion factor (SCO1/SenC/PrrC family)